MDFKILVLVVVLCAACKSEKEFDMLVRLDPRVCPELVSKCRQSCVRLDYQIGFCNSKHQCVCVKESPIDTSAVLREDSVLASKEEKQSRYAKRDFIEGQITSFLSRILRFGVSPEKLLRCIESNPLFRKLEEDRVESEERERQNDENEVENDKIPSRKRIIRVKTEIVPIIIYRNQKPEKANDEELERRTFPSKNSLLEDRAGTTPKIISGKLELFKVPKLLKSGRSDIKYIEDEYQTQKEDNNVRDVNDLVPDTDKDKLANGQSIETVRIFLFPAFRDEPKSEPKETAVTPRPANKTSTPLEVLKQRFLSFLSRRTKNIINENPETTENVLAEEKSVQVIEKTNVPLSPEAEKKATGKREIALRNFERTEKEIVATTTQTAETDKVLISENATPTKIVKSDKTPIENENSPTDQPAKSLESEDKSETLAIARTRRRVFESVENENDNFGDNSNEEISAEEEDEVD